MLLYILSWNLSDYTILFCIIKHKADMI